MNNEISWVLQVWLGLDARWMFVAKRASLEEIESVAALVEKGVKWRVVQRVEGGGYEGMNV